MLLYFFICLAACGVGAISGMGGGVLIKPIMDAVSSYSAHQVSFFSGCTVLSMSLVSMLRSRKNGIKLDMKMGTSMALGSAAGGIFGKQIFGLATLGDLGETVTLVQSWVMLILCAVVFVYTLLKNKITPRSVHNPLACALIGLGLGTLSAFLGIGGGPINIMVISYLLGTDSKTTAAYSLYSILFSQIFSLGFTIISGKVPVIEPLTPVSMVAGGIAGALLGAYLSKEMKNSQVDKCFMAVLCGIGLILCYNIFA